MGRLLELVAAYVRAQRVGEAFVSPLDVKLEPAWCSNLTCSSFHLPDFFSEVLPEDERD